MNMVSFAFNNGLALLLGALIGFEQQWRQRNAGLRTNALVTLGSSLFVSLSMLMDGPIDHTRISAQLVIRKVLVQEVIQESLLLQSIESEDISGTDKVEVRAFVVTGLATGKDCGSHEP